MLTGKERIEGWKVFDEEIFNEGYCFCCGGEPDGREYYLNVSIYCAYGAGW